MITLFTPVHGRYDVASRTLAALDKVVPASFVHLIGDDFSPQPDAELYAASAGPIIRDGQEIGQRVVYHCRELGAEDSPNMGLSLGHAFEVARENGSEALLVVESDVIPRPGIVEAFREAHELHGERTGAVAPLYTEVGGNTIASFGGMSGGEEAERNFLGLKLGMEIGSWDQRQPRLDVLWWAHLACLWLPRSTLLLDTVSPDPDFALYYCDHDLSHQIREHAGLDLVITDRAVAEHSREAASTGVRWPDEDARHAVEAAAYSTLRQKWHF